VSDSFFPATRELPLFAELPRLRDAVPWRPLVHAPTPAEPCRSPWLGRDGIFHKRDDRVSPLYGGNKIRRFEFLFADAERRGARTLVTVGGLASTQMMATVLFGKRLGFDVCAALFDQPVTSFARDAILTGVGAGGQLVHGGSYVGTALRTVAAYRRVERPYLILPGASTPLAILGYVDAMLELGEQVRRHEVPRPDIIVVPAGSGGTLAGLALGAALLRWPTVVTGVRITELIACNRATIRWLIEATSRFLRRHAGPAAKLRLGEARFALHHGAIGGGYGYPTPSAIEAIPEVERLIGVPGEVTYSGKGLTGLRAVARANPTATVLYWHTLSSVRPAVSPTALDTVSTSFDKVFAGPVSI
jgi:1-aminocyclopropane-1-carboxylate deaminase/D-cysteine desulfhydrase-like pyridoxal-dependent ACC family enzyme